MTTAVTELPRLDWPAAPAPSAPVAPAPEPEDPVDPAAIRWPELRGEARGELDRGRALLDRAVDQYRTLASLDSAEQPRRLIQADAMLGEALLAIHRAGVTLPGVSLPELRGFWHELLLRPLDAKDARAVEHRAAYLLEAFPGDAFALHALLAAKTWQRDPESIAAYARQILVVRPNDAEARHHLAIALFALGRYAEALPEAERVSAQLPGDPEVWRLLAETGFALSKRDVAVRAVIAGLGAGGFPDPSITERGARLLETALKVFHRYGEFERLAEVAAVYRGRHPDDVFATAMEGLARSALGDHAGAEPLLRAGLADAENRAEIRFWLGLGLAKSGRHAEARSELAGLLRADPWFERAYYQLGLVLVRLGDRERADAFFAHARELAPSERAIRRSDEILASGSPLEAARSRVRGHVARGQFALALDALGDPALATDAAAALDRLGFHVRMLRLADARRAHAELARASAPAISLRGGAAEILWIEGDESRAIAQLGDLARDAGDALGARVWKLVLARRLLERRRFAEAVEILEPLRQGASDREESYLLARALSGTGAFERAAELFQSISSGDTRYDVWRVAAWLERARAGVDAHDELAPADSPETIAKRIEVAKTAWSSSAAARVELARLYRDAGRRDEAIEHALLAATADPRSAAALELIVALFDRPGEVFLRWKHLDDLAAFAPSAELEARIASLSEEWPHEG